MEEGPTTDNQTGQAMSGFAAIVILYLLAAIVCGVSLCSFTRSIDPKRLSNLGTEGFLFLVMVSLVWPVVAVCMLGKWSGIWKWHW